MVRWSAVVVALLAVICVATAVIDSAEPLSKPGDNDDYLVKQVIWKKCHRKLTPACLKLSLVRTMEMMSKDSSLFLVPGVFFSSNTTDSTPMPADLARSLTQEHAHMDDLVSFAVSRYMRSVTLNVNLVDFLSGGNETVQNSLVDAFSGRAKGGGGLGAYGGLALVLGGSLASMMLAALAALAGKALMTSMLALMMSALAAMKGSGGGGGGEHKTYEVITKPIVSHVNTHSSEVQHEHGGHHHYRRSLGRGVVAEEVESEPYVAYALEGQRLMRSANLEADAQEVGSDPHSDFGEHERRIVRSPNLQGVPEEITTDSSETLDEENRRNKRSLDLTRKDIFEINKAFLRDPHRNKRNVGELIDQEKSSSEVHNAYFELPDKDKHNFNTKNSQETSESLLEVSQKEKRSPDKIFEATDLNGKSNIYYSRQVERQEVRRKRNPIEVFENPKDKNYNSIIYLPKRPQDFQREKRDVHNYEPNKVSSAEINLNYYKPPFKYIPNTPNLRIKRNVDGAYLTDSRIYHIYPNPNEYVSNNPPVRDQLTSGDRRYKRNSKVRQIMPLALVG